MCPFLIFKPSSRVYFCEVKRRKIISSNTVCHIFFSYWGDQISWVSSTSLSKQIKQNSRVNAADFWTRHSTILIHVSIFSRSARFHATPTLLSCQTPVTLFALFQITWLPHYTHLLTCSHQPCSIYTCLFPVRTSLLCSSLSGPASLPESRTPAFLSNPFLC